MSKNKKYLFELLAGLLVYVTVVVFMFSDDSFLTKEHKSQVGHKSIINAPTTTKEYDENNSTLKFLSTPIPAMDSIGSTSSIIVMDSNSASAAVVATVMDSIH